MFYIYREIRKNTFGSITDSFIQYMGTANTKADLLVWLRENTLPGQDPNKEFHIIQGKRIHVRVDEHEETYTYTEERKRVVIDGIALIGAD